MHPGDISTLTVTDGSTTMGRRPPTASPEQAAASRTGENDHADEVIRRHIVAAAKHLFARYGYEGTSYHDVADSAKITPGELSYHFDDKLAILTAILDDGWARINQRLDYVLLNSVSAREGWVSLMAMMMRLLETDEDMARLLVFESHRPNPVSGAASLSLGQLTFERLCTQLVQWGQKDGNFAEFYNPQIIACVLTGAIEKLMRMQLIGEDMHGRPPFTAREIVMAYDALAADFKQRDI